MRNFDLEYDLNEFRQVHRDLFDSNGKRYGSVNLSNREAELMLSLINRMEVEIGELEAALDCYEKGI